MKITNTWWLRRTLETEHQELLKKYYKLTSQNGLCLVLRRRTVNVQVIFIIRTSEKNFVVNNYYQHKTSRYTFRNANDVIKKLYELNNETLLV